MTIFVNAVVRYWEDGTVDGVRDTTGGLIPCREGESWCPKIDSETGEILNWESGKMAEIHYKVADEYSHIIKDGQKIVENLQNEYVPDFMCPKENGHGDYVIMDIDKNGMIQDWKY